MCVVLANKTIPRDEYLQEELVSEMRHEYIAGHVYAMSGGTLNHQRISLNFLRLSGNQLSGKSCFPTGSDFKLQIDLGSGDEAFYYPDGMIICQPVAGDALFTNSPSVILEVLSPSTRRNDEVQKFRDYLTIPTLQTYILAETDAPYLTIYRRDESGFQKETLSGLETVLHLPESGISIALAELYDGVN